MTELLVVLVIIGLLAAVVGPRLFSRLDDAKQRTARLQISRLEAAVDLFRLDVGRLPSEEEGLDALVMPPPEADAWLGPYLSNNGLPRDPWGNAYAYSVDADARQFHVVSFGADGREGGSGSDADIGVAIEESERGEEPAP